MSWNHRHPIYNSEDESYEDYEARCVAYEEAKDARAEEYIERRYEREYQDI